MIFRRVADEAQSKMSRRTHRGPKEHIVSALTEAVKKTNVQRILETAQAASADGTPWREESAAANADAPLEERSTSDA